MKKLVTGGSLSEGDSYQIHKIIENLDFEKQPSKDEGKIQLLQHPQEAMDKWIGAGMKGIFTMVTRTGKTFTALGCLIEAAKIYPHLLTVISYPSLYWRRCLKCPKTSSKS